MLDITKESLITGKKQFKTTMRYYFTPSTMAKIRKTDNK